jgi:hypothetical protein
MSGNTPPGESALITPADGSSFAQDNKCFNCGGPHHLRSCPKPRGQATIDKNRAIHPSSPCHQQPTGFKGRHLWSRPTKWRLPEEGENNKRIIDNNPFTFNPSSKRWELDSTPESGQRYVPAANVAPSPAPAPPAAQPPAASQPPSPSTLPDMKGGFFSGGYGPAEDMDNDTKKQMIALQMKHLQQQQWNKM